VKLQVQKYAVASCRNLFDNRWSTPREKAAADLEAANEPSQPVGERARLAGGIDVERD